MFRAAYGSAAISDSIIAFAGICRLKSTRLCIARQASAISDAKAAARAIRLRRCRRIFRLATSDDTASPISAISPSTPVSLAISK